MEVASVSAPLPECLLSPRSASNCCIYAKPASRIQLAALSNIAKPPPVPPGILAAPKVAATSPQSPSWRGPQVLLGRTGSIREAGVPGKATAGKAPPPEGSQDY